MKTLIILIALSCSSLALAQVDGKCLVTEKSSMSVKLVKDSFQMTLGKSSCSGAITKAVNLDRGPLLKEIFYVDLSACDSKLFRKTGFLKFEKRVKGVQGLANVLADGPVVCQYPKADWQKLKDLSLAHP